MTTTAEIKKRTPRFVPCPICKGARGEYEAVPGCYGDGPFYPCGGCNGEGSLAAYRSHQAAEEERMMREQEFICRDCGHEAGRHYPGHNACAFDWHDSDRSIATCQCKRSLESVMNDAIHSLLGRGGSGVEPQTKGTQND